MTAQAESPLYIRVDGDTSSLGSEEPVSEAHARWESARDQGLAYGAIVALNTAIWLAQDALTDSEVTEAIANAIGHRYPRPIFDTEPTVPTWALGMLEHDTRFQQLTPDVVHVSADARRALVAQLRDRLVKAAWKIEGNTEGLTAADVDALVETIQDAREWLDALGAFPDGENPETGPDVQPRASYLETLARETLNGDQDAGTRIALTQLVEQFEQSPAAASLVEVEIPAQLVQLVRDGVIGVMAGAADNIGVTHFDEAAAWRADARHVQLSVELVDLIDEPPGDGPARLAATPDQAGQLVAAIDYTAGGLEDDVRAAKDGAEMVRLARTLEQLRALRETIAA